MNFNLHLALQCAEKIRALYAGELAPNIVAKSTDTQVLVEKMVDGRFLIVFPGTASARDWRTDLQVHRVPWDAQKDSGNPFAPDGMKVHSGFKAAHDSIYAGLEEMIAPGRSVVIAGHSLGGALATLCAHALHGLVNVTDVITFGSPRVGNARFVGEYESTLGARTARIVNAHDPVPHVPLLFGLYRHVPTQVWLGPDFELRIAEPLRVAVTEWAETITTLRTAPASELRLASAHHIEAYLGKLKGISRLA